MLIGVGMGWGMGPSQQREADQRANQMPIQTYATKDQPPCPIQQPHPLPRANLETTTGVRCDEAVVEGVLLRGECRHLAGQALVLVRQPVETGLHRAHPRLHRRQLALAAILLVVRHLFPRQRDEEKIFGEKAYGKNPKKR